MILTLKPLIFERLKPDLAALNVIILDPEDGDGWRSKHTNQRGQHHWDNDGCEIEMAALTRRECQKLLQLLQDCDVHGTKMAAADVKNYLKASDEGVELALQFKPTN